MKIKLRIKNSLRDIDFGDYEGEVKISTQDGGRVLEGVPYNVTFERYEIREGVYKLRLNITEKKCKGKYND